MTGCEELSPAGSHVNWTLNNVVMDQLLDMGDPKPQPSGTMASQRASFVDEWIEVSGILGGRDVLGII